MAETRTAKENTNEGNTGITTGIATIVTDMRRVDHTETRPMIDKDEADIAVEGHIHPPSHDHGLHLVG